MHEFLKPKGPTVNFALFGAHSRKYMTGIVIRKYRHLSGKNKISIFPQVCKMSTDSNICANIGAVMNAIRLSNALSNALGLELFYRCVYVYCFLLSFFYALCVCA